ncbi:MAG: spore germination protein [Clostridia bacterium]|nr:spore germination protein [Clostridia bacterium]MBR5144645.1 spore germination protein [Clostridia bacterium]
MRLSKDYGWNVSQISQRLGVKKSFDIIERHLDTAGGELTLFYIDGFVKDGEMQRVMQYLLSQKSINGAGEMVRRLPYMEVDLECDIEKMITAVLSGQSLMLAESFLDEAVLIDMRTYPARNTAEPDSDRVMQGAHDGFVETLVMNTALIRRRIRDENLTMEHVSVSAASKTDVVICYMSDRADQRVVGEVRSRIEDAMPKSLTLGFQSLAESIIKKGWINPFPKIRTTERPDTAAAHLMEGSVIVLCDTSPRAMILPTSIFDYLQQTDDYYFPPLTGTYMRLVRAVILLLSVVSTPLWYMCIYYADILPEGLKFLLPESPGALPVLLQLILVELAIDGLKIASMNTPDMLSNSLSVVGALILGDFAIEVGWLCADVIFYMAFVAIANFAQQNHELGYALKFVRIITLLLCAYIGIYGFVGGLLFGAFLVLTNRTVNKKGYLYPLIPFNPVALARLLFRIKKKDFSHKSERTG